MSATVGYPDGGTHLAEELERVDQLVRARTERFRAGIGATKPTEEWGFPGVADEEVTGYLRTGFRLARRLEPVGSRLEPPLLQPPAALVHEAAVASVQARIDTRLAATTIQTPFQRLRQAFDLDRIQADVLLLALLPELEPAYRRLFAVLMDDATRTLPTVDLITEMLAPELPGAAAARAAFTGRLLTDELVHLEPGGAPGLHGVWVDPRVVGHLLGSDNPDVRVAAVLGELPVAPGWDALVLEPDLITRLQRLADRYRQSPPSAELVLLHGPYGSGRRSVASAVCAQADLPVFTAEVGLALQTGFEQGVRLVYREARLRGAAVGWIGPEPLLTGDDEAERRWAGLIAAAVDHPGPTLVISERPWEPGGAARGLRFTRFDLPAPTYPQRVRLWQQALVGAPELAAGTDHDRLIASLSNAFQLTGGQIADATASARSLAGSRDEEGITIGADDLFEGCRRQSGRRLVAFARRIEPRAGLSFDDLVLPRTSGRQLDELRSRIVHSNRVYDEFGFERRITLGQGVVAMFTGASGTGKTMAAELLAREQGADLYKVDLAAVVSKFVGETEKNLDRVFEDAERANAMIFFDEADALFAKRGEVREARDRWANVELAFLLQRIEEHRGVVILASNLRQNIDEAFLRRLHSVVDFPQPDPRARLRIWLGMFPSGLGRPPDDVIADLAARFALPGGSIRNVVVDAAFRALRRNEQADALELRDLVVSVGREYAKLQLPITPGEFGPEFYGWVEHELLADEPASEGDTDG